MDCYLDCQEKTKKGGRRDPPKRVASYALGSSDSRPVVLTPSQPLTLAWQDACTHRGSPGSSWKGLGGTGASLSTTGSQWGGRGPPKAHLAVLQTFGVVPFEGGGGYWHGGQGCWETRCRARAAPPPRNALPPNANRPRLRSPAPAAVFLGGSTSIVRGSL